MKADVYKIISTCIKNDIKIYPVVYQPELNKGTRNPKCQIEVCIKGRCIVLPDIHRQDTKLYDKIQELYKTYYNDYFN